MSVLNSQRFKVFVSYPGIDGLDKAREAANVLAQSGHTPWFYEQHKTLGATVFREIAVSIRRKVDILLYICTTASFSSWGQQLEAGYALTNRYVKIIVVAFDDAPIPDELTPFNHSRIQSSDFDTHIRGIVEKLPGIVERIQRLDEEIKATIE